jgi:hypothetical protein
MRSRPKVGVSKDEGVDTELATILRDGRYAPSSGMMFKNGAFKSLKAEIRSVCV